MDENVNVNDKLSDIHIDALKEIGNIGLGNAATSLANMLNKKVDMKVPNTKFVSMVETMEMVGGLEEVVSCVALRVEGDITAQVLFVFDEKSSYYLIDMLMGMDKGTTTQMDEVCQSAVKEIANMLTGAFLSAISTMTGLKIKPNVPMFAFDMLGAVLSTSLIEGGYVDDHILVIETVMFEKEKNINGKFFFIAKKESLNKLFSALGISI
ncbi:chemotaxis protein CheC [Peptococcaceae bacterium]|nr:chemotaxis protein CheC [Peptococcaceae bacterium]